MTKLVLVLNGWAAGIEAWDLCSFPHDWVINYMEQLAGVPEKLLQDAADKSVVLVGWSMGGSSALRLALRYPQKLAGLVLVSATPRMLADKATGWRGMSEHRLEALWRGTLMVFANDPDAVYCEANMAKGLEYLRTTDLRADLLSFSQQGKFADLKVRMIQSKADGIVSINNIEFLQQIFPQAETTLIEGNEHVLPITIPQVIDRAVCDIITP